MIIEKSRVLQEKLEKLNNLERRQKEIRYVDDTLTQLKDVKKHVLSLVKQYETVKHLLSDADQEEIDTRFRIIYENLQELERSFQENFEQSRDLGSLRDRAITQCLELFKGTWAKQVDSAVSNDRDVYSLIKDLPDVRASRESIESALRRLDKFRVYPPSTENELAEFQANVNTLKSQIGNIEGLTPEVLQFLRKMAENRATIADLTPSVLDWCRQPTRVNHFTIQFAEGA